MFLLFSCYYHKVSYKKGLVLFDGKKMACILKLMANFLFSPYDMRNLLVGPSILKNILKYP